MDVYVSYARQDMEVVTRLVERLTEAGITVFWDRTIAPAEEWKATAEAALERAQVLLVCAGAKGLESQFQLEEVFKTEALKKPILPVRLRGFPGFNKLPPRLQQIQWLDYEEERDEAFAMLLAAIRRLTGASPEGPRPRTFDWGIVVSEGDRAYADELALELEAVGAGRVVVRGADEGLTRNEASNIVVIIDQQPGDKVRALVESGVQAVIVPDRSRPRDLPFLKDKSTPQLSRYRLWPATTMARTLMDPIALQREGAPRCPWEYRPDDPVVFGRALEGSAIVLSLATSPRLLLVTAPARSGKTAFIRGTVWSDPLRKAPLPGGNHSWGSLVVAQDPAAELKAWKRSWLESDLRGTDGAIDPKALAEHEKELPLSAALRRVVSGRYSLIWVDQFEKVFDADDTSCEALLSELAEAVTSDSGVHVLACIRSESLGRLRNHPSFGPLVEDALFELAPMQRAALKEVITGAAAEFDLDVEPALAERVLDDVGEGPAAVDTISTVMAEVWRVRSGSTLTLSAYRKLGGAFKIASEALARRAERDVDAGVRLMPGFSADSIGQEDKLDIKPVVEAFCSVMLSREVEPPLSIGLFGDWGSGKSFFMEEMWRQVEALAKDAKTQNSKHWHGHVAQIRFNAWHYSDTNLWASFVTQIFDELSRVINPGESRQETRAKLLKELESSKTLAAEAGFELEAAKKELGVSKEQLETQRVDLATRLRTLSGIRLGDVQTMLSDPIVIQSSEVQDLQSNLADLSRRLGVGQAMQTVEQLGQAVNRARTITGTARALWSDVRTSQSRVRLVMAATVLALPALALGASYIVALPWTARMADTLRLTIAAVTQAGMVLLGLGKFLPPVLTKIKRLQQIHGRLTQEARARDEQQLRPAQAAVDAAQAAVTGAEEATKRAEQRVADAERAYVEASAGRRFFKFIEERSGSDDYRKHLGLISLVHRDFRELQALLEDCRRYAPDGDTKDSQSTTAGVQRIDRIVLYIDDLDRCQPQLVVAVLQAVHLLLALPLFVVVVGVDPRWLLRALEVHYPEFLSVRYRKGTDRSKTTEEERNEAPATTPQNYLEKIFQIPFCLPAMGKRGFEDLVESLARDERGGARATEAGRAAREALHASLNAGVPSQGSQPPPQAPGSVKPDPQAKGAASGSDSRAGVERDSDAAAKRKQQPAAGTVSDAQGPPRTATKADARPPRPIAISRSEREFMRELHPIIQTPRATKRFVNVYRLVRTIRLNTEGKVAEADYQVTLTLLALNMSAQRFANQLFRELDRRSPLTSWSTVIEALAPRRAGDRWTSSAGNLSDEEAADWSRITSCLGDLARRFSMPTQLAPYQQCAEEIARFAFWPLEEVARIPSADTSGV